MMEVKMLTDRFIMVLNAPCWSHSDWGFKVWNPDRSQMREIILTMEIKKEAT
jgi:hypothetical protein